MPNIVGVDRYSYNRFHSTHPNHISAQDMPPDPREEKRGDRLVLVIHSLSSATFSLPCRVWPQAAFGSRSKD